MESKPRSRLLLNNCMPRELSTLGKAVESSPQTSEKDAYSFSTKKTRHSPPKWASVGVGTAYICSKISVFFYNTEADSRIMYYTVLILYMYYIVLCIMIPWFD